MCSLERVGQLGRRAPVVVGYAVADLAGEFCDMSGCNWKRAWFRGGGNEGR